MLSQPTPTDQNFRIRNENTEKACDLALESLEACLKQKKFPKYYIICFGTFMIHPTYGHNTGKVVKTVKEPDPLFFAFKKEQILPGTSRGRKDSER
jgi:hypothetical protein